MNHHCVQRCPHNGPVKKKENYLHHMNINTEQLIRNQTLTKNTTYKWTGRIEYATVSTSLERLERVKQIVVKISLVKGKT